MLLLLPVLFGLAEALFLRTLFAPLVTLNSTIDNCSSARWISIGGVRSSVPVHFCSQYRNATMIVNTAPQILLASELQKNAFEVQLELSDSVFSAIFSINDTEGESEALVQISVALKNASGTEITAAVFARFVFTEVEFSDTALMVLSIVAAISIIALICILIYIAANRFVEMRLNSEARNSEGARSYPNIADDTQPLVVPPSECDEPIPVRARPKESPEISQESTETSSKNEPDADDQ
ncbi:hypothetical protein QR680_013083 [Steinernema hermaphroditum]|uniref:Uncharacterized protein n=1 Tax=Steinernema hermaphroditum TaxID=289476 RepID=A0AA39I4B5_9BILA|nr:hypothetical protein QR680_013083 [Steinernema hermaphroditum]